MSTAELGDPGRPTVPPADIDALFAKIREARQDAVAEAHEVLGHDGRARESHPAPSAAAEYAGVAQPAVVTATAEPVVVVGSDVEDVEGPQGQNGAAPAAEPSIEAEADGLPARTAEIAGVGVRSDQVGPLAEPDGGPEATDVPNSSGHVPDEAAAALLDRRDGATDVIERRLSRRLKRVLSDEQNEMLDLVRRTRGLPTADALIPDRAVHAQRYAEAAAGDLAGASAAGAAFYGGAAGAELSPVADLAERLAGELVGQLHDRLERCFEDSSGEEAELDDRIRACYREWKTQRIADMSRHFVLGAFTRGLFDTTPDGTAFRWVIDDGGTPCPDAEDNALGGEVARGQPFPTGDLHPPAHPGCRCLIVPVEQMSASPVPPVTPRVEA